MHQFILASASPRRKEILEQVGVAFTVSVSRKKEETIRKAPEKVVMELSAQKAEDVAESAGVNTIVIGADTVVSYKGQILGKPKDEKEAESMLLKLQGTVHQVYTGVTIVIKGENEERRTLRFYEETKVFLRSMTVEQIRSYIATGEPMDKAGSYGIQGRFAVYVKRIEGDYYNVVGLPIQAIYTALRGEGIPLVE